MIDWAQLGRITTVLRHRVRYGLRAELRKSRLGILWWFAEPAIFFGIYYLVFGAFYQTRGAHYVTILITGLLPWTWFARTLQNSVNVLYGARQQLLSLDLPIAVYPASVVMQDFAKEIGVLVVGVSILALLADLGVAHLACFLLFVVLQLALHLMLAQLSGLLGALIQDLRHVLPSLLTAAMFGSAVFYEPGVLGGWAAALVNANPLTHMVEGYRHALLYGELYLPGVLIMLAMTLGAWLASRLITARMGERITLFLLR
jgi:lipopolysaccharide transport system permease protein